MSRAFAQGGGRVIVPSSNPENTGLIKRLNKQQVRIERLEKVVDFLVNAHNRKYKAASECLEDLGKILD